MTRREKDRIRYLAKREERIERQRAYYKANRDEILAKARLRRLGMQMRKTITDGERADMARKRNRDYYARHMDKILSDRRKKRYEMLKCGVNS